MKVLTQSERMKKRWEDPEFRKMMSKKSSIWMKGRPSPMKGKKTSDEAKKKQSEARIKYFQKEENRQSMSVKMTGKKQSEEHVRKKVVKSKKWWRTEAGTERKMRLVEMAKSKEVREKVSKALTGKPKSKECNKKISDSLKRKWQESEYRDKMLTANRTEKMRKKRSKLSDGKNNPMYEVRGKDAPAWNGGTAYLPYGGKFHKRTKERIKKRDGYVCQNPECGSREDLVVHHIDYDKENCEDNNLITVCRGCNAKANFNREKWEVFYKQLLNKKYD